MFRKRAKFGYQAERHKWKTRAKNLKYSSTLYRYFSHVLKDKIQLFFHNLGNCYELLGNFDQYTEEQSGHSCLKSNYINGSTEALLIATFANKRSYRKSR